MNNLPTWIHPALIQANIEANEKNYENLIENKIILM